MYHNVLLLALCQAMLMTGTSLILSSSALIGARLAPAASLATVPLSLQLIATMLCLFPASRLMQRLGRRPVFIGGALVGACGVALAAFGIYVESFLIFALAGVLIGTHNAIGQFYRFAAVEAVDISLRSRAISFTLAGGVIAAFLGPNLARFTRDTLAPPFVASFLALILVTALAALFASRLRVPAPSAETATGEKRPLAVILRQPVFIVALLTGTIGYGEMVLLMTATPLAMHAHNHTFPDTAATIQWHVVAMFAPSFFTGDLIRWFGVLRVITFGCALIFGCVVVNLAGTSVLHFEAALILLGLGWNFLYVGATTLLTETYLPAEKARVQALNDTIVFTTVSGSSLASAVLLSHFGWSAINLAAIPAMMVVLSATLWLMWHRKSAAAAAVSNAQ